ncbi:MAG: DUF6378 domain-containing protein [Dehalococcoidia bacterium]
MKRVITERQTTHGVPEDTFGRIADIWLSLGIVTDYNLPPRTTVALAMAGFKMARLAAQAANSERGAKLSRDHFVDAIGYLANAYEQAVAEGVVDPVAGAGDE